MAVPNRIVQRTVEMFRLAKVMTLMQLTDLLGCIHRARFIDGLKSGSAIPAITTIVATMFYLKSSNLMNMEFGASKAFFSRVSAISKRPLWA